MLSLIALLSSLVMGGCAAHTHSASLLPAAHDAEVVFVGRILDIGEAPGTWSTYYPAFQTVVYEVEEVWKGSLSEKEVSVDHVIVYGSALGEAGQGALNPHVFSRSERLIVFARADRDRLIVDREQDGVVSFTRENQRVAKQALAMQAD